jgi:hypothetical protein
VSDQPSSLRLRFETIGSIAAIVVGVAAILVSWDQGRVMRAQQHASVLPAIQMDGHVNENAGRLAVGLRMRNNGVGPALIHDFSLEVGGQAINSWDQFSDLAPARAGRNWSTVTGRVLGQGESITAIELFWTEGDVTDVDALRDFVEQLTTTVQADICYCSVFDRCFVSSMRPDGANLPRPVRACPPTTAWINQVRVGDEADASP